MIQAVMVVPGALASLSYIFNIIKNINSKMVP